MANDSVLTDIRQARDALAERFDYDLRAMIQDARERQAVGGRKVVTFPPRPVRLTSSTPLPNQRMQLAGVAHDG